jgi:hypothetical protein
MSKKERDLPKPKKTPFGKSRHENEGQDDLLMADRMAMAAAEGRLNEYLEQEIPEGEYAKKLATMMMGMTGILPQEGLSVDAQQKSPSSEPVEACKVFSGDAAPAVPEDIAEAVKTGDVETLKELLLREKQKRSPGPVETVEEIQKPDHPQSSPSMIEKDMIDAMIKVAFDNKVSVDWLMARALKLYLEEYQKTGRL